ncbi:MAG TPA: protease pro-enzyme activation domain-containing protein, partial [Candidatus Saccharimonadales bacterium]|nr:protease pro-enzyme activation domain-containing protein [Candidatus Saccharimonadales bacterium]
MKAAIKLGIIALLVALLPMVAGASVIVSRHVPAEARHLQPLDRLPASNRLNLAIGLPVQNRAVLTQLLRDLYDPANPRFHQYLTAAQFAAQFGPTEQHYQAVVKFAQSNGLTVTGTHANRLLVDVSGSVEEIEKAFHTHLRVYQHPTEGRTFYAPDSDPWLDLSVPVLGINGLDDFILPHPMNIQTADATAYTSGSGPSGFFIGNDFRAAYAPGVTLTGAGQAVGLFELDGYDVQDIMEYESLAKLPNMALTNILLDGFSGTAGANNLEVALDIDMAICMAPGLSRVIVYEGLTPNDVLNRMATDNQARQLSSSWGFGPQTDPVRAQIFEEFAAQGQTMFQASGDSGAYSGQVSSP